MIARENLLVNRALKETPGMFPLAVAFSVITALQGVGKRTGYLRDL